MQLRYFLFHQDTVVVVEKKVKPPVNFFRGTVLRDVNTKKTDTKKLIAFQWARF